MIMTHLAGSAPVIEKKLVLMIAAILMVCILECVRLGVIMTVKSEYYMQKADELHQRERRIKAKRGRILDRNGEILAANEVVCTVSVIHSQIEDEDKVIKVLAGELDMDVEEVTKKVKKYPLWNILRQMWQRILEMQ